MQIKNWSKNDESKYNSLFNNLKIKYNDLNFETFINDKKKYILGYIENNDKWKDTTKERYIFLISKWLQINKENDRYIKIYQEAGYKFLMKNRDNENENKQDEREIINYRPRQYFIDILNKINYNEIQTETGRQQYLLLNLLVYQPPVRTNFYITCKFLRNIKENNGIDNYIYINKRGKNHVYFIVNNDKVSNTKEYKTNNKLNKIEIEDNNLINLIVNSYENNKRIYLFEIDKKNITHATYLNWLKSITGVEGINNNMMRSSYINSFYETSRTLKEKEKTAKQMRHSVMTANRNYLKIDDKKQNTGEDKNLIIEKLKQEILESKKEIFELKNKNNKEVIITNKNIRDVLYNLNIRKVKPFEKTLQKYNIVFNDEKELYEIKN